MNGHDEKAKDNIEQIEGEINKMPVGTSFMLPGLGEQPKVCIYLCGPIYHVLTQSIYTYY